MCFVGRRISYSASLFFLFPCCSLLCTYSSYTTARSRQQKHKMARSADLARSADPNDAPPALPVLATACDGEVCLWECGATDPLVTFEPHQESITGLRWTSNDRVLASSSHDGTVALSEPSGRLFHTLRPNSSGATPAILSITWSPGSRYLAAGGSDAIVRIFDLPRERTDQGFIDLVGRRLFAVFPLHLHGYIHRLMGTGGRGLLFVLLPLLCPQLALLPVRPERVNDRQVLVDTRLWVGHCARWHSTLQ